MPTSSSTPAAGPCCRGCTTTTSTCWRWPRRGSRSASARRTSAIAPPFDTALRAAATSGTGWLRGIGFHESVAGPLDRDRLDALVPDRPVRVQHRSGAMWVLNSAALAVTGLADLDEPGVERDTTAAPPVALYRLDDVLRRRIGAAPPDLAAVGRELAGYGVTAVCDMTPTDEADEVDLLAAARLPVTRHRRRGGPALPPTAGADLARGPVKFVLDDARLPPIDVLARAVPHGPPGSGGRSPCTA